jgi:hypothetical protein
MIVLDPHQIIRLENILKRLKIYFVYILVGIPVVSIICHITRQVMEQGPDGSVAEPEIKLIHLFFGEKDRVSLQVG